MMKRSLALLLSVFCLSPATYAQEQAPKLLREAAQCLISKTFLKATPLSLGYLVDKKSWPGEEVLYVVSYTSASRTRGYVFTIFLKMQNRRQLFNIQNNAKFVRTKKISDGVDFVEAPLGGIWTQEHLVSAIKQIERLPRFEVPASELSQASSLVGCHSYADNQ